jgi:hypothetical protein
MQYMTGKKTNANNRSFLKVRLLPNMFRFFSIAVSFFCFQYNALPSGSAPEKTSTGINFGKLKPFLLICPPYCFLCMQYFTQYVVTLFTVGAR